MMADSGFVLTIEDRWSGGPPDDRSAPDAGSGAPSQPHSPGQGPSSPGDADIRQMLTGLVPDPALHLFDPRQQGQEIDAEIAAVRKMLEETGEAIRQSMAAAMAPIAVPGMPQPAWTPPGAAGTPSLLPLDGFRPANTGPAPGIAADDIRSMLMGMGGADKPIEAPDVKSLLEALKPPKELLEFERLLAGDDIKEMLEGINQTIAIEKEAARRIGEEVELSMREITQRQATKKADEHEKAIRDEMARQVPEVPVHEFNVGSKDIIFDPVQQLQERLRKNAETWDQQHQIDLATLSSGEALLQVARQRVEDELTSRATKHALDEILLNSEKTQAKLAQARLESEQDAYAMQQRMRDQRDAAGGVEFDAQRIAEDRRYNMDRKGKLQTAIDRADPDWARQRDAAAGGDLANRAGLPGGRTASAVGGHLEQLGKLPDAMGGLGEAGGLAAAAGPIGAAIEVVQTVSKEVAASMDAARRSIELLGDVAADVAGNNYLQAMNRSIDATAQSLSKIPLVGDMLASQFSLALQPVKSFSDVVNAFVDRGKQLQDFSPELSATNAMNDLRQMMANMDEAQTLGPSLSRLSDAQMDLQLKLQEMLMPIKELLIEKLADWLERGLILVDNIEGAVQKMITLINGILTVLGDLASFRGSDAIKHIDETLDAMHKAGERDRSEKKKDETAAGILDIFYNLGPVLDLG